jgi:hypothetical protein
MCNNADFMESAYNFNRSEVNLRGSRVECTELEYNIAKVFGQLYSLIYRNLLNDDENKFLVYVNVETYGIHGCGNV